MHRIFISYYHHDDQWYKDELRSKYDGEVFIDKSVNTNDIDDNGKTTEQIYQIIRDDYLRNTTVTILLIGKNTDKRKHVDREIGSSLRHTKHNKRSGILGILLPNHPCYNYFHYYKHLNKSNTQKRFVDNLKVGYAVLAKWDDCINKGTDFLDKIIEKAFKRSKEINPDNSEPFRQHNSSN